MDGDAVAAALGGDLDVRALENVPYIFRRVAALHLFKENIPHLIVAAQVLDLPYHFIFCHGTSSFRRLSNFGPVEDGLRQRTLAVAEGEEEEGSVLPQKLQENPVPLPHGNNVI